MRTCLFYLNFKIYLHKIDHEHESCSVVSHSLQPHGLYSVYSSWNAPDQNTGVGNLPFLQGTFPTQGSNPGLLHYIQILYQLNHKASPRIREWVAYPLSSRSSLPRNQPGVSCITGRFFTNWAIREAQNWSLYYHYILMSATSATLSTVFLNVFDVSSF